MPSPYESAFADRLPGLDDESLLRTLVTVTANPGDYRPEVVAAGRNVAWGIAWCLFGTSLMILSQYYLDDRRPPGGPHLFFLGAPGRQGVVSTPTGHRPIAESQVAARTRLSGYRPRVYQIDPGVW